MLVSVAIKLTVLQHAVKDKHLTWSKPLPPLSHPCPL